MNQNNISRYIWKKILFKEWKAGEEIPSINALSIKLNKSPSTIKYTIKKFIVNRIIVTKSKSKMYINSEIYSIFPFNISCKFNAEKFFGKWSSENNQLTLINKYKLSDTNNIIISKTSFYDKSIDKDSLKENQHISEILFSLNRFPERVSILTKIGTGVNEGKVVQKVVGYDVKKLIILTMEIVIPSENWFQKDVWSI